MSVMMFLQCFVWGAWFTTLGLCLNVNGMGTIIGSAYGTAPIAAIIAPLFLGLVADRFFPSQWVMGVLMLLGGVAVAWPIVHGPSQVRLCGCSGSPCANWQPIVQIDTHVPQIDAKPAKFN